jgi:hypothetical protein
MDLVGNAVPQPSVYAACLRALWTRQNQQRAGRCGGG